ncbi:protein NipSnap homolog 1 isoform X1 [Mycteria americana]|uniref:protein NipSnap homolog 1 isoform X1 n=1 Tax=Mycteria americana TaxID=33587 RepID=UPI003F5853BE
MGTLTGPPLPLPPQDPHGRRRRAPPPGPRPRRHPRPGHPALPARAAGPRLREGGAGAAQGPPRPPRHARLAAQAGQLGAAALEAPLVCARRSLPLLLPGSEQRVRGGLPLPGYEIRVLPPAPASPRTPRFLFTAEHPGMRTYCLGAETPEELNAWVCALRRGASPLPGSPHSLSLQTSQEPRSAGPPAPPLPTRPPGWCSLCPPGEELGSPPTPPPHRPPVPPLPPSKEEAPARGGPCGTEDTRGEPRGPPVGAVAAAAGRSPRELRPPGADANQQLPPLAGRGPDAAEQDTATNQTVLTPTGSSDWLLASEGSDGALPFPGTASPPAANETSSRPRAGAGGRGSEREGVAGRGARRPIRITLLQASF